MEASADTVASACELLLQCNRSAARAILETKNDDTAALFLLGWLEDDCNNYLPALLFYAKSKTCWKTTKEFDSAAVLFLEEQAKRDVWSAVYAVGVLHERGVTEGGKKQKLAIEFFERAAKHNHVRALGALALCYDTGDGVEANSNRANELYEVSSELHA
jgi:TPR repeat protein